MTDRPKNTAELRSRLAAALPGLRDRYPIRTLGVFGSWARGEQTPESDVDLLVEFEKPVGFFELSRLEDELAILLDVRVDLATPGALKPRMSERVLRELLPT